MGREGQEPVLELNGGVGKGKSDYVLGDYRIQAVKGLTFYRGLTEGFCARSQG